MGGLLVAATLKYADAILKCFATAFSIILSTVLGYYWLRAQVDLFVFIGVACTVLSLFNYTLDDTEKSSNNSNSSGGATPSSKQ